MGILYLQSSLSKSICVECFSDSALQYMYCCYEIFLKNTLKNLWDILVNMLIIS
jgi:hypothetical protein